MPERGLFFELAVHLLGSARPYETDIQDVVAMGGCRTRAPDFSCWPSKLAHIPGFAIGEPRSSAKASSGRYGKVIAVQPAAGRMNE
jgi:hypothetical protein